MHRVPTEIEEIMSRAGVGFGWGTRGGLRPGSGFSVRGRIGVVKLLRARGGCLGVIRWRAWKAAKGPGELPNERRSRNTR